MILPVLFTVSGMKHLQKVKTLINYLGWLILAQISLAGTAIADDDLEQGRKLAGQCKTCHGSYGIAQIPIAPNIAGEPEQYIINQLKAYQSGDREHEMMSVVAKTLDDEKIDKLAKWYASQKFSVSANESADHSSISNCVECHGSNGIATQLNTPHLAGESIIYIDTQLKAFRSGKRTHEIMSDIAAQLTDEQMRAASEWYSAIEFNVLKE